MVGVVDARFLLGVDVFGWDPHRSAGVAVVGSGFDCLPACSGAGDEGVAGVAGDGFVVDVGGTAVDPFVRVVHSAEGGWCGAAGSGAAAVECDEGDALVEARKSFGSTQVEGSARVVEDREPGAGLFGQFQCFWDRDATTGGGGGNAGGVSS